MQDKTTTNSPTETVSDAETIDEMKLWLTMALDSKEFTNEQIVKAVGKFCAKLAYQSHLAGVLQENPDAMLRTPKVEPTVDKWEELHKILQSLTADVMRGKKSQWEALNEYEPQIQSLLTHSLQEAKAESKPSAQWVINTLVEQLDGVTATEDGEYLERDGVYRVIKELQESLAYLKQEESLEVNKGGKV